MLHDGTSVLQIFLQYDSTAVFKV